MTNKTYIICEIGINHQGDHALARKLIDLSAASGANAVKFQKRHIDSVYSQEELASPRQSKWGNSFRQQKEGLEFSIQQYKELEKYTTDKGLDFIVSCWDLVSLKEVEDNLNVKYHKLASALLTHKKFLEALNDTGKPVIVSTGMSTQEEIDKAMSVLKNVFYIMACTSTYPTKSEEVNLNYIKTLKEKYPSKKIAFSNHYSGLVACFGAVALGAEALEVHICDDRTREGSDFAASIEHIGELVGGIRHLEQMLGDGKKVVYDSEKPIIAKLRKVNTL